MPNGKTVIGDLNLKGASTLLRVHSEEMLPRIDGGASIKGISYCGKHLTLIDCRSPGMGRTGLGASVQYHADVFPHYVLIGNAHLDSEQRNVCGIQFTTSDLTALFYDFDAFSHLIEPRPFIEAVLQERRQMRPVEIGEHPEIQYFTGKELIVQAQTVLGKISVRHQPRINMGGPAGVSMKNRIVVSIEPENPVTLTEAFGCMYDVICFLSMAAGRVQDIRHVSVTTNEMHANDFPQSLAVYESYRWKLSDKSEQRRPHPGDVPFDPIRQRAEFEKALPNWLSRHDGWRTSRSQYLGCMRKGSLYDSDRLVAAANMFDIVPSAATPLAIELSEELAATRDASVAMFREHAPGVDRNSALSALGRLGKPSLPKKVAHRVSIVEAQLGGRFSDLQFVASVAVKCRNFFVHGSAGDIEYGKVASLVPFLTDALEFIFAASDFIDAGWDAHRWNSAAHGWGHNFARFRSEYDGALAELRCATSS